MSIGISVESITPLKTKPFSYRGDLDKKGVTPDGGDDTVERWQRLWLEIDKVDAKVFGHNKVLKRPIGFVVEKVKIKVSARQMVISESGELKDKENQDPSDSCYKFAKAFTDNYEEICKHYPIFDRLKHLYKAMSIAEWMYINKVPVDIEAVKKMIDLTRIPKNKHNLLVPSLSNDIKHEKFIRKLFGGVSLNVGLSQCVANTQFDELSEASTNDTNDASFSSDTLPEEIKENELAKAKPDIKKSILKDDTKHTPQKDLKPQVTNPKTTNPKDIKSKDAKDSNTTLKTPETKPEEIA
jgi:hypothetical protein